MAGSAVAAAPCSFFAAGKCRNGAACKFSHAAGAEPKAPSRRAPCKFFLQNACTAGRECKFSHDVDEADAAAASALLTTTSAGERKPAPGAFGTRCRFYDKGACATGSACPYRHVDGGRGRGHNNSDHGGSSGGGSRTGAPQARKPPVAVSTVKMHVLQPARKQSNATAEGTQTEGEATQQDMEVDEDDAAEGARGSGSGGVAKLSDFLTKEEELYYYGAPGEFDNDEDAAASSPLERKPSYAEVARHNLPSSSDEDEQYALQMEGPGAPPKTCTYYLQGLCRYGDSCFYAHSLETAPATADEHELVQQEIRDSADLECGICYDLIILKGERFGLLSGCDHAFCLPCVRNWRGHADQPKQTVRQCPVCRLDTHFVIPSNRMVKDPVRKKKLMSEYTKNLAAIPCRHFDEGRGTCPFGTSCFYAHRYPTGEEEVRQVRTAVDSEGQYDVLRNMRLDHFFQNLEIS